jgi:hypothetical protein
VRFCFIFDGGFSVVEFLFIIGRFTGNSLLKDKPQRGNEYGK